MAFVTGTGLTVENNNARSPVTFTLTTPTVTVTGDKVVMKGTASAPLVSGAFAIELAPGDYEMKIGGQLVGTIAVPNDGATYGYAELLVTDTYLIPSTPAGGAQPNASATVLGVVKTNTDPGGGADPVVYLKTEVDSIIAGMSGGTASDVGGIPTFDFSHTTIANFVFSNGILNIGIAADGITPIFSVAGTP